MAQDDPKGQPAGGRGKSPVQRAPDTPDARHMAAPPPPEAPLHEPAPADSGATAATASAGIAAHAPEDKPAEGGGGAGGGGSGGGGGGATGEAESDRLRREIAEAERALAAKRTELAAAEDKRKADEAKAKLVEDYSKEVAALTATAEGLQQYQLAETSFLSKFLDATAMQKIPDASAGPEQEIHELTAKIEADSQAAAAEKAKLGAAKQLAAAAKAKAEGLKRPAASVRDRLKAADAVRAEAKKASDAGNYALAYWLIMEGGRLDALLKQEPRIIQASDLPAAITQSAAEQATAEAELAALEGRIKTLEAGIQADTARLAALNAKLESKVRESLAQFNPKSAETA
ncbi:MAG TPA: hypothetical protein VGD66_08520 [Allosphingosinicella sp.]|jgi:hypothetical protein